MQTKWGGWGSFLGYIWEEEAPNCAGGPWWWEESSLCSVCLFSWSWIGRALWALLRIVISPLSLSVEDLPLGRWTAKLTGQRLPLTLLELGLRMLGFSNYPLINSFWFSSSQAVSLFGFFDLGDFCLGMVFDNLSVVCLAMTPPRAWDSGKGDTQNT